MREDIYFFEVNDKYISSNVLKYFWYRKKSKFSFYFPLRGETYGYMQEQNSHSPSTQSSEYPSSVVGVGFTRV